MTRRTIIILTMICLLNIFGLSRSAFAVEDAIIAVVNDEVITLKDLKDYMNAVYTELKMEGRYSSDDIKQIMEQVQKDGINRLIDDRLILNAANEMKMEAKSSAIDKKIEAFKAKYHSEQDFLDALASEGLSVTELRQRIADQLKSQFFVDTEIKSKSKVNPQEVTAYYEKNPEKFMRPERADVDSIFIPYGTDKNDARKTADKAYTLLTQGKPFKDVAKQYSKAPSIGIIPRGQIKPEIEQKIFALQPGGFTQPIENEQGIFIFKLKQRLPADKVSREEANDQISQFLFNQKLQESIKDWLQEARKNAYIDIKNP